MEEDEMLRISLASVRIVMGAAAIGLAVWGGWKLGTYLADKALSEKSSPWGGSVDPSAEAKTAPPLWRRTFSPISAG